MYNELDEAYSAEKFTLDDGDPKFEPKKLYTKLMAND